MLPSTQPHLHNGHCSAHVCNVSHVGFELAAVRLSDLIGARLPVYGKHAQGFCLWEENLAWVAVFRMPPADRASDLCDGLPVPYAVTLFLKLFHSSLQLRNLSVLRWQYRFSIHIGHSSS